MAIVSLRSLSSEKCVRCCRVSTADKLSLSSANVPASNLCMSKSRKMSLGIVIPAFGNAALRVVVEAGDDLAKLLTLFHARYVSSTTVSRIAAQTQFLCMTYDGQRMPDHSNQYTSLFSQLKRIGNEARILETHKALTSLSSINQNFFLVPTAAALRTKTTNKLSCKYVVSTLID